MKVAGIDIGTNTVRGVVLLKKNSGWRVIKSLRKVTGLGRDFKKGLLHPKSIERTVKGIKNILKELEKCGVEKTYLAGTHSLRESQNGYEVKKLIEKETGEKVDVLTGEEEAIFTAKGIFFNSQIKGDVLCFDIGGGSTEFIILRNEKLVKILSLKIGLVRTVEDFLNSDPPSEENKKRIEQFFLKQLSRCNILNSSFDRVYSSCGTLTALVMILKNLKQYRREEIENYFLKKEKFDQVKAMVLSRNSKERLKLPGIEKGKEDVIVAGILYVDVIFKISGVKGIYVSENGWLEGYVLSKLQQI